MTTGAQTGAAVDPGALRAVADAIAGLRDDAIETLREAIRIPSVNPTFETDPAQAGELRVSVFLAETARRLGLEVDHWEPAPGRGNVTATVRGAGGRSLLIGGHTDTVPAGAGTWTHNGPYSGALDRGAVFGRGACDMKGGTVAALFAAAAIRAAGVPLGGNLIAHGVVGEESGEHDLGTMGMIRRGHHADAAIIGEPTGGRGPLALAIASVGWLFLRIDVAGKPTHVAVRGRIRRMGAAGSELGVNAIEKALVIMNALRDLELRWDTGKRHSLFEPGDFCIHPGVIHGGPRGLDNPAIFSDYTTLWYSVLYPPTEPTAAIIGEVEAAIGDACRADPWLAEHPPEIAWPLDWPPASVEPDQPIARAAAAAVGDIVALGGAGREPRFAAMQGVTDASWLTRAGIAAIVSGPGSASAAHAIDEHVPVDEFLDAIRLYAAAALRWCGTR